MLLEAFKDCVFFTAIYLIFWLRHTKWKQESYHFTWIRTSFVSTLNIQNLAHQFTVLEKNFIPTCKLILFASDRSEGKLSTLGQIQLLPVYVPWAKLVYIYFLSLRKAIRLMYFLTYEKCMKFKFRFS